MKDLSLNKEYLMLAQIKHLALNKVIEALNRDKILEAHTIISIYNSAKNALTS